MKTPPDLARYAAPLTKVYQEVTDALLVNIARHFNVKATGNTGSFDYQVKMLAQMGQLTQENMAIIARYTGANSELLKEALTQSILAALDKCEPELAAAAKAGFLSGGPEPIELSPGVRNAFEQYYHQAYDKLNMVNTVMLQSSLDQYRKVITDTVTYEMRLEAAQTALNTSTGEVITGVSTRQQAVRKAVQQMLRAGLTGFVDAGGHRWSPEAYVNMDIRTTVTNTAHQATWARCDEYGVDTIEVSVKAAAREGCYPWQGKVLSRTNNARTITDGSAREIEVIPMIATSYGQPAGLFGINCGHFSSPFIPGYSALSNTPVPDPETNNQQYMESQIQRGLERRIRDAKLMLSAAKAMEDQDMIAKGRDLVRFAQADMTEFIDATGRTRRRDREYTPTTFNEIWHKPD